MNQLKTNQSFDQTGKQFAWDSTSIKLAEECLRKYYYKMIEGWQPRDKSIHLIFGGHFATALEHYYKHRALGATSPEALESVVHEALINTWNHELDEEGNRVPGTGSPVEFLHNAKTRENLIRTIIWYVAQFENESIKVIHLSDGRPAVEYSFSIPVDDGIVFSGHLDRMVEYVGDPYVMDQKTTGSTISASYFNQFAPDTQMSMYTFAGKIIYNAPVKGVIIDAAQVMVGFTRFERGFTFRNEDQLNEWYDDTMFHIETARHAVQEQYFPMNRSSCNNFLGCEFRGICSRSPDSRQRHLEAEFTKGPTWDPLDRR